MLLQTLAWQPKTGWSAPWPAGMDSPSTLAVIFGGRASPGTEGAVGEIAARLPNSVLAGCSTAGEIHGDQVADASLSVAIASFAHVTLRKVLLPIRDPVEAFAVGRDLGRALAAPDLRAVFVLSDGLNVNGSRLTSGLREALPDSVVVTGGLAGDGERFGSTWVIGERGPTDRCVTALGF